MEVARSGAKGPKVGANDEWHNDCYHALSLTAQWRKSEREEEHDPPRVIL